MPAAVDCAPRTPICSRAPPDPLRPHGRATHAHGVVGERTDPINAKLGERGTSKGGLSGIFCCCIPAFSPPFFIRTKTNKCFFCFVLAVCHSSALEPWTLDVKLEVAPPPPPLPQDRAMPAPHGSTRRHRRKIGHQLPTRRSGIIVQPYALWWKHLVPFFGRF